MKKQLTILIFVLISGQVLADGWNTNAWPSYQYPRSGKIHNEDCYSGLVERATVISWSPPAAPTWYRGQQSELEVYKTWVSGAAQAKFKDPSKMSGTKFDVYFSGGGSDFPCYTTSNLLKNLNLPLNYLSYTPYRCLCGLGPFTNDTTVGHPYGWTNATTTAGGANFPAGRSTWYTTDYGWQGMKDIINELYLTSSTISFSDGTNSIVTGWGKSKYDSYTHPREDLNYQPSCYVWGNCNNWDKWGFDDSAYLRSPFALVTRGGGDPGFSVDGWEDSAAGGCLSVLKLHVPFADGGAEVISDWYYKVQCTLSGTLTWDWWGAGYHDVAVYFPEMYDNTMHFISGNLMAEKAYAKTGWSWINENITVIIHPSYDDKVEYWANYDFDPWEITAKLTDYSFIASAIVSKRFNAAFRNEYAAITAYDCERSLYLIGAANAEHPTIYEWHSLIPNLTTNQYHYIASETSHDQYEIFLSDWSTNVPYSDSGEVPDGQEWGYSVGSGLMLYKWDVTDGFKYK